MSVRLHFEQSPDEAELDLASELNVDNVTNNKGWFSHFRIFQ